MKERSQNVKLAIANWTFVMRETSTSTQLFIVKDALCKKVEKELLERDAFTIRRLLKPYSAKFISDLIINEKTGLPKVSKIDFVKECGDCNESYDTIRHNILTDRSGANNIQVDLFEGEPRPDKCPVWTALLKEELTKPYMKELQDFLAEERKTKKIYPASKDVFNAFKLTHYNEVRVVLLAQDPFHFPSVANGLVFSCAGKTTSPTLSNIFKEIKNEYPEATFESNDLSCWAKQGVLMLNTVLTTEEGKASAHKGRGWEKYVEQVIRKLMEKEDVFFVAWGQHAQGIVDYIGLEFNFRSAHPAPISADGFFGNNHFRLVNSYLTDKPINWSIK